MVRGTLVLSAVAAQSSTEVPSVTLNNGVKMPVMAFAAQVWPADTMRGQERLNEWSQARHKQPLCCRPCRRHHPFDELVQIRHSPLQLLRCADRLEHRVDVIPRYAALDEEWVDLRAQLAEAVQAHE